MGSPAATRRTFFAAAVAAAIFSLLSSSMASVTYDHRALVVNGQRKILISGSIHYPRSDPQMWPGIIQKAKDGGLDVVQTYVFWNGHEPSRGKYYFEGSYDLVRFVKLVHQAGLFVHLRIGPYICAEWNFGGFPVWLKYVRGIKFRTDNAPFKAEMQRFTEKIVSMMKSQRLFESQGGPIILSQIENEFGPIENGGGAAAKSYAHWAGEMAVGLGTGVPWVMCKQDDAPDPVINTCNGFYCDYFSPNKPTKPKIWTEAWTGWYTAFGGSVPHRPVEDLAFAVARFIQKGGSFINYYMYHGGTNFGRTSGGSFMATSYDYDAPIDEYGLLNQPKWGHLRELHKAIKLCEPALVATDPVATPLGGSVQAYVYKSRRSCAAFLSNIDTKMHAKVTFNGVHFSIPPWSMSILPDCKTAVFNTAQVGVRTNRAKMSPVGGFSWMAYDEDTDSLDGKSFVKRGLYDQVSLTWDESDYLWYTTTVNIAQSEHFLKNGWYPKLNVHSAGDVLHVFINGKRTGTAYGGLRNPRVVYSGTVKMRAGANKISILSVTVGLPNVGNHFETWNAGVIGPVTLSGLDEGTRDLSHQQWTYQVGLKGESLGLHTLSGSSSVEWAKAYLKQQPATWYKAFFNEPSGTAPLALDMGSMGKGQVWINGQNLGRYWPGYLARGGSCGGGCDYRGTYNENKCATNCGESSQRWYHVPRAWLRPTGNLIVVFEEWGGDPTRISMATRSVGDGWVLDTDGVWRDCVGQTNCSVFAMSEALGGDRCRETAENLASEAICD